MKDEDYKDMVIAHDKHIDLLASSIESLANNVGATNGKLDDVIDVITQQNVLVERMNNLDTNVAESFNRAWGRFEKLEDMASHDGCEVAKKLHQDKELFNEKLKVSNKRVKDLEDDVKDTTDKIANTVSASTIKWAIGIFLSYSVIFGAYVVDTMHETDNTVNSYISADVERTDVVSDKLDDIQTQLRDIYGNPVTVLYGPTVDSARDF